MLAFKIHCYAAKDLFHPLLMSDAHFSIFVRVFLSRGVLRLCAYAIPRIAVSRRMWISGTMNIDAAYLRGKKMYDDSTLNVGRYKCASIVGKRHPLRCSIVYY